MAEWHFEEQALVPEPGCEIIQRTLVAATANGSVGIPFDETSAVAAGKILAALDAATREAVVRRAAAEAGLVVITRDQGSAIIADELGEPTRWATLTGAHLSIAEQVGRPEITAALSGVEADHDGE